MTQLIINDDKCWQCGKPFTDPEDPRTMHHVLPKHLNPVSNIQIPIHESCHKIVTSQDMAALTAHAYRLLREVAQLSGSVEGLTSTLATATIIKVKK